MRGKLYLLKNNGSEKETRIMNENESKCVCVYRSRERQGQKYKKDESHK